MGHFYIGGNIPFADICKRVLESALKGTLSSDLFSSSFRKLLFDAQLIHHSSAVGTAFKPHFDEKKGRNYRKVFECLKENDE